MGKKMSSLAKAGFPPPHSGIAAAKRSGRFEIMSQVPKPPLDWPAIYTRLESMLYSDFTASNISTTMRSCALRSIGLELAHPSVDWGTSTNDGYRAWVSG